MFNSSKLLALAFCLSIIISLNVSKASEQILADITIDVFSDSYQLKINANEENQTISAVYIDNLSNGKLVSRDEISINSFIKEGIKIPHNSPINFAKISGENFDKEQGGILTIDAIYNILTGRRKSIEMELAKDQSGWKLFKAGQNITQIKAVINKIPVIGMVGVKDFEMK